MLLEEAILHLLRSCGYKTIETKNGDPTLDDGPSGLEVRGRGCNHQIDAIADFIIHQPFSNPMRLLLEAKFRRNRTGVDVVRNAVGVLRDVSEYWVGRAGAGHHDRSTRNARRRYHYQYAVFSVSGFSKLAQDYAFAQDVYLLPLRENRFVGPVVQAVDDFAKAAEDEDGAEPLGELRKRVRRRLRGEMAFESRRNDEPGSEEDRFVGAVHMVDFALLAMIGNQFPVFMVPSPDMVSRGLTELRDEQPIRVRVYWDQDGWYLRRANRNEEVLFSFDLPEALFLRYADGGILTRASALRLKGEQLSRFQAFWIIDDRLELLTFELDQAWLDDVRQQLRQQ